MSCAVSELEDAPKGQMICYRLAQGQLTLQYFLLPMWGNVWTLAESLGRERINQKGKLIEVELTEAYFFVQ